MKSAGTRQLLVSRNRQLAKKIWREALTKWHRRTLTELTLVFKFSVALGDLLLLDGKWYVTHTGLIRLAHRGRCAGIRVEVLDRFCDASVGRWYFKAMVYKSRRCRGFVGHGDADPSNISPLLHGAEMRIAETRAVNRALRKAYGIGICSVEELGSPEREQSQHRIAKIPPQPANGNHRQGKVRDRLCQIIRHYDLDPALVKAYATDFCGTKALREATRDQVEDFVSHLAHRAANDRDGLLCQLNSYLPKQGNAA